MRVALYGNRKGLHDHEVKWKGEKWCTFTDSLSRWIIDGQIGGQREWRENKGESVSG